MLQPQFRPHLTPALLPPDQLYLLSETGSYLVKGRSAVRVAELLLEGPREVDAIIAGAPDLDAAQVRYVLAFLEARGYTCDASDGLDRSNAGYWSALGVAPAEAAVRVANAEVQVVALGGLDATPLRAALAANGVPLTATGTPVVLCEDLLDPALEAINRAALASGTPWLLVRPVGLELLVGPLFDPGTTGCWECLRQRVAANRSVQDFLAEAGSGQRMRPVSLGSAVGLAAGLVATEITRFLVTGSTPLRGTVLSLSTWDWSQDRHTLVRRPQCPACGDPEMLRRVRPVRVESCPKLHTRDGGHRSSTPRETLDRLGHHVSPLTGIVQGLDRVTPEDDDLAHVFVSGQNMAVRQASYQQLRRNLRSRSCGKGISETQARVSAICEAIERYSGVYRGTEERLRDSLVGLGDRAIDPRACMLFSEAQYAARDAINAKGSSFHRIPDVFDPDEILDWSPLWSLTRQAPRYLPTTLLYYSAPVDGDRQSCLPDSNGCAAGNTLEEAILQGALELVERDAVACWWYNRLAMPALDLDTVDHPYVQRMRQRHARIGRHLWVLDLRHDLGIPVFVALSRRVDRQPEDIVFAPAAHLDPTVALVRALTELNQMMPAVHDGDPAPGQYSYDDPDCVRWWSTATLANQPYLAPSSGPAVRFEGIPYTARDDIRDDVLALQGRFESLGHEVLVLDQTRPDTGVSVAKVVVPGLRHFWARLAPGRLYDVPVRQGLVPSRLAESDLNPIAMFI